MLESVRVGGGGGEVGGDAVVMFLVGCEEENCVVTGV